MEEERARSRKNTVQMVVIGVIATVLGTALSLVIDWMPVQASDQAEQIDTLLDVLWIASVPFAVLVIVIVLFCVIKFRMRPGEELKDGPPVHGNTRLEVVWTAIPSVIIVALCVYAFVVLRDIEEAKADTMVINVTGQQFAWRFEYPRQDGRVVRSTQLYLPQGQPVEFKVRTEDVLHSFWVPEWRMKIDAVPGITTHYRVTTKRIGRYPVVCTELCGYGHATMRQTAHILPRPQFDRWMARQRPEAANAG